VLRGRKPPSSLAAYDCVLRADALPFGDPEARAEVRRLSEKAIELDPTYGRAYSRPPFLGGRKSGRNSFLCSAASDELSS